MLKTIILIAVLVVITVAFITFLVVDYKRLERKEKTFFINSTFLNIYIVIDSACPRVKSRSVISCRHPFDSLDCCDIQYHNEDEQIHRHLLRDTSATSTRYIALCLRRVIRPLASSLHHISRMPRRCSRAMPPTRY